MYGWTAAQIKAAIDRCEKETEERIKRHESPERIADGRKHIDTLRRWLAEAERKERENG